MAVEQSYSENTVEKLRQGYERAVVSEQIDADPAYMPQLVYNNVQEGTKVIATLEDGLRHCDRFFISVAFITEGGLEPLKLTLRELEQRGIPGKILTTDYLTFTDPKALDALHSLTNLDVRMYRSADEGFHTKGYIFFRGNVYEILIGSSNLTQAALTKSWEWNTRLVSTKDGAYAKAVLQQFDQLWNSEHTQKYEDFIEEYREAFAVSQQQKKLAREAIKKQGLTPGTAQMYKLQPNSMQTDFLLNIRQLRDEGETKALLCSSTGTGKTYASAFALRDMNPKRALFLVHREQIAAQAMESYQRVFGNTKTMGLLSGTHHDVDRDFIFSTVQTMSRQSTMEAFSKKAFDAIVIDEVHRAAGETYQRIMRYFEPKFWLGMTATPERMDGFDIFGLFEHNIALEIRLQQAMEEDLLCPFHYFGLSDLTLENQTVEDEKRLTPQQRLRQFDFLVRDERVRHVMREAAYYGYSGDRVRGLIFVSRREEGKKLSERFNDFGWRTVFLSGEDSQEYRDACIERLSAEGNPDDALDYLITVDIFGEGVDIPCVNQVIFLRPTQSPVVFVQQLGRGLRKMQGKEYVVILDFVANYDNNYMIPVALSGDRSYNKDNMRRFVSDGNRVIPGSSTIHFDEITRRRIYASIDSARTNQTKQLKEAYFNLKAKLGRIPTMRDFDRFGTVDMLKYISRMGSYYAFLQKYETDYHDDSANMLSDVEAEILQYLSKKFASGKRCKELLFLRRLIQQRQRLITYRDAIEKLSTDGMRARVVSPFEERTVVSGLDTTFLQGSDPHTYRHCRLVEKQEGHGYCLTAEFAQLLEHQAFAAWVDEIIDFGLARYQQSFAQTYEDTDLVLYRKYNYEDVCRLLNWAKAQNPQNIGGYQYDAETKCLPVFINYNKEDNSVAYEDRFESATDLIALSKNQRSVNSQDADHIYRRKPEDKDNKIYLFVRKNKDDQEAKEFYFLGQMDAVGKPEAVIRDLGDGRTANAFEIRYKLRQAVRPDIYEYLTSSEAG